MPQIPGDARLPQEPTDDRLNSWKEIAAYFNRDVTTVQRWEKREGMPVHRHLHDKIGSIYASRSELGTWARTRILKVPEGQESTIAVAGPEPALPPAEPSRLQQQDFVARKSRYVVVLWTLGLAAALAAGVSFFLQSNDYFWRSPLEGAHFQIVTDFEGEARDAALSRDGHFVAFLSDHDGPVDVWVTQIGSGTFHNLTRGSAVDLVNPDLRALSFSPDSSLVTFWTRKHSGPNNGIGVWGVPTLGGQPQPYLDGVAEFDWSADATRLAYHTPGPGDPLFVTEGFKGARGTPILTAPPGQHSHFPLWSPDASYIYFVQGTLPDKMDIWRIRPNGGKPERITTRSGYVRYPVFLDRDTLLYLESDPDGSGPWLYEMNLRRRIAHRLTSGPERYVSLAASPGGRRAVATLSNAKRTLWRMQLSDPTQAASAATPISVPTGAGIYPRLGPDYLNLCFLHWVRRQHLEICGWTGCGIMVCSGRADFREPNNFCRWTFCGISRPARQPEPNVCHAGGWHQSTCDYRFVRVSGSGRLVTGRPVTHDRSQPKRRSTTISDTCGRHSAGRAGF